MCARYRGDDDFVFRAAGAWSAGEVERRLFGDERGPRACAAAAVGGDFEALGLQPLGATRPSDYPIPLQSTAFERLVFLEAFERFVLAVCTDMGLSEI